MEGDESAARKHPEGTGEPTVADSTPPAGHGRRDFLRRAGLFSGFLGLGTILQKYGTQYFLIPRAPTQADSPRSEWAGSRVQAYRTLGRTGWQMSDISFGTAHTRDANVVRAALDRGITYIDTSPDYSDAESERVVGQAIAGRRDKVFVASKFCTTDGHLPTDASVATIIEAVEGSLKRLGTDYLDLCHIHACDEIERLMATNFHEAFDRLKEQGKVRFMGVSSHTPNLEAVMNRAVDSGRFDVIMVAYNFENWPDLTNIIDKAHANNVGFVAMKTLKGAYHTALADFTPDERNSFTQAAFKWVHGNPKVSGLVVSISHTEQLDEYLFASGKALAPSDLSLLQKYDKAIARHYCRPGCGQCLGSCPAGLPIDDVLRYSMYFDSYRSERLAMVKYDRLPAERKASICASCSAPCEKACPFDVPIREKMTRAHALLSLPGRA
ncbi:MAG TPA: aldo/keto reductase [Candidatus Binatia bacterium]|nr:aldo/keto reductase [Candidatus Binatia bacterium]